MAEFRRFSKTGTAYAELFPSPGQHRKQPRKRKIIMTNINDTAAKFFAAVSALAVSAVFMATAIAPATQNIATSGILA